MAFDEEEKDAQMNAAQSLISKGDELAHEGKFKAAVSLFLKAIAELLDAGEWMKLADLFNHIVALTQSESQILLIMDKLRDVISTVETLDIPEEEGKLKLALAQMQSKDEDYLNAGNSFIEVADLFYRADPEEFRKQSGMFLLKAAECFERIARTERSEHLVLEAIKRFEISIFDPNPIEKEFQRLIKKKKYAEAYEKLREIAGFFRQLESNLQKAEEDNQIMADLKRNVSARLLYTVSEYNFLKMVCFRYLEDFEKVQSQAEKSIHDLTNVIEFYKEEIKGGDFSKAEVRRLTYSTFLLQTFQEYANFQVEDPIDLCTRGLSSEVIEEIKKMQHYEYLTRILELGLQDNLRWIEEMELGPRLNQYREFILNSFKISLTH